jgi:hypothetical protein
MEESTLTLTEENNRYLGITQLTSFPDKEQTCNNQGLLKMMFSVWSNPRLAQQVAACSCRQH